MVLEATALPTEPQPLHVLFVLRSTEKLTLLEQLIDTANVYKSHYLFLVQKQMSQIDQIKKQIINQGPNI